MVDSGDVTPTQKRKRQRTSPEQLDLLEQLFQTNTTPNQQMRLQLESDLGMSARRIQIWFQNKRAKVLHFYGYFLKSAKVRRGKSKNDSPLNQEQDVSDSPQQQPEKPHIDHESSTGTLSPSSSPSQDLLSPRGSPPCDPSPALLASSSPLQPAHHPVIPPLPTLEQQGLLIVNPLAKFTRDISEKKL